MSDQPHEPDTAVDAAAPVQMQVAPLVVELAGANVRVVPHPANPNLRAMIVGPLLVNFVLPLNDDASRTIADELTRPMIAIVPAGSVPPPRMDVPRGRR